MVDKWLIIGAVAYYFCVITCTFFTAQVAQEKGRKKYWGWLGFLLGLLGFVIVCFLPNTKKVTGETNPIRLAFKKIRSISPAAVWIILAGIPVVIISVVFGPKLIASFTEKAPTALIKEEEDEKEKYLTPTLVEGDVQSLCCGEKSNYVFTVEGDVYAWGDCALSALDESGVVYREAEKLCMAGDTYYVLTSDGVLYAKGNNENHLIPGQSAKNVKDFVKVEGKVKDIALCESMGAILKESGNLYVFGVNTYGQLSTEKASVSGTDHLLAKKIKKVIATEYSLYYMNEKGEVFAVGNNAYGQFGKGHSEPQAAAIKIAKGCTDFAAGDDFVMLLKKDGTVWTAGNDCYGQLGRKTAEQFEQELSNADKANETVEDAETNGEEEQAEDKKEEKEKEKEKEKEPECIKSESFGKVEELSDVTAIAAGGRCAFAFCDEALYAWGENYLGQLGLEPAAQVILPQLVHEEALMVDTNGSCTLLFTKEGELLGAGDHRYRQLGEQSGSGFIALAEAKGAES